ncbi:MAG: branched chain amino acid aminotransferase [Crocinitomicaceae bacterium]|jgi:branched-chain amino acid aminotransferase|nr:branched chain amino acid aminotransferase [Crocinitomicaceae bacterium]
MLQDTINIKVNTTTKSRISEVNWEDLPFGKVFADHMLLMEYKDGQWQDAEIVPFGEIGFHPATSAIHYGQSIFEGLKAYKNQDGEVRIFRPDMNAKRFIESCERMCMPIIPEQLFVECVRKLVEVDQNWIPDREGYSLYIRPFMFATDEFVGIRPSETYKFMIFTCPVGSYYSEPVRVKIEETYTRAAEGGVGRAKAAGNYGASLFPARKGQAEGFHQMLWTDAKTHEYIEESGTMNVMFVINGKLVTPSEESDTILRGITKRSVIDVAKHWGMEVEERKVSVKEIVEGIRNGSVTECFGAGTAATIAHIIKMGYRDEVLDLNPVENRPFSMKMSQYLDDLKAGKEQDVFGWTLKV